MAFCGSRPATIVLRNTPHVRTNGSRRITIACSRTATKCTSARRTYRCTVITIARIRPSSRRASSGFGRPKSAERPAIVRLPARGQRTFTADAVGVSIRSKIRQTWVSGLKILYGSYSVIKISVHCRKTQDLPYQG